MIKRQNGEYYVSPNGDKAGVMELLIKKTKELDRQVTAEDILADATMPAVNTFAGYYDGGFEAAASKAYRKVMEAAENPEQAKEQPKSEKPPMTREEILEKVADACFQHGDNTGWINEQELRKLIPIKDVFKAFKKGGVKELRNEVKAVLYSRKHPDKRPQPQPELSAKVVISDSV
jgi:hypothetical protein